MTQAQFASLLRTHPTTVSRWEAETQIASPDAWQMDIMMVMSIGCTKQPSVADVAVNFLLTGRVGFALGVLLGAAVQGEPSPKVS